MPSPSRPVEGGPRDQARQPPSGVLRRHDSESMALHKIKTTGRNCEMKQMGLGQCILSFIYVLIGGKQTTYTRLLQNSMFHVQNSYKFTMFYKQQYEQTAQRNWTG